MNQNFNYVSIIFISISFLRYIRTFYSMLFLVSDCVNFIINKYNYYYCVLLIILCGNNINELNT